MTLSIGLFYPSAKAIHALNPAIAAGNPDVCDFQSHVEVVQAAEEVGLDYLFLADAWAPYGARNTAMGLQDPMLMAPILGSMLAAITRRIRIITTIHTSWFNPLQVARIGGTLDTLSNGRWAMNLVSGTGFADSLVGVPGHDLPHDQRYERASEFVEVLTQFWSGNDLDYSGKHFQFKGKIVGPRTVQQPRPTIVSAGASEAGRHFAGCHADIIFMPGRTPLDECNSRVGDIRRIAVENGRKEDDVKLQMHASVVVRESAAEAKALSDEIHDGIDLEAVAEYLNSVRSHISTYDEIYAAMGEMQLRQIGSVSGARKIHGDPDKVVDEFRTLATDFGCDGVAVSLPIWSADEIRNFGKLVLPRLEAEGLWQRAAG